MSKRISILGGGESGVGAAILAAQKGFEVFISDNKTINPVLKSEIEKRCLPYEEGGHTWETIFESIEVIKSPGIPDHLPMIRELRKAGIPVISEIEFAARYTSAKLIGITGSNGKTTTTLLIDHLLKTAGIDACLAGNVGPSFARKLAEQDHDYFVLELSSFQLDGIKGFQPHIALLLNITADHLDRYEMDVRKYGAAKFRIGMNQTQEEYFLYWPNDPMTVDLMIDWDGKGKRIAIHPDQLEFRLTSNSLRGMHNQINSAFAVKTARLIGLNDVQIQKGLDSFTNAPHRLETVGTIEGIEFINDSKATNVDAVFYGLDAMTKPVVWIAGGIDKGNDYDQIQGLVKQKVKALICLGADNIKLKESFNYLPHIEETQDVNEAINLALKYGSEGDVALLSPACSSFDLFENFAARGDLFRAAVKRRRI